MPQLLSLSRAARLVDTTRAILQTQIRNSALTTFEGKIAVTDLLRLYPHAKLENDEMLERVENIKAKTSPKNREKPCLPSSEILAERLTSLSYELVEAKQHLRHYHQCGEQLLEKIKYFSNQDHISKESLQDLLCWVQQEMQQSLDKSDAKTRLLAKDTFLRMIAAHVKIIPSGREFFVEGNASLLESALKSGIHANFGCSSGNCGSCKARVVSGEVHKLRNYEYDLTESEKNLGYILMCSYTAITDLALEMSEATCVEDLPVQTILTKVEKTEVLNEDFVLLNLRTPKTNILRFMAGQFVTLQLNELKADFYIASCPCDGHNLQFHIRRNQTELVKQIFEGLPAKHLVSIDGPKGHFTMRESTNPVLFLAWEQGFAPIKSMLEHAISIDTIESFNLEWFSATPNGHYLEKLCRSWSDALDNFNYHLTQTSEIDLKHHLKNRLKSMDYKTKDFYVYIVAPAFFIETVKPLLLEHGFTLQNIQVTEI
jgi:CDP-4-dehydro-6-deoxyglucose reductase, E3